MKLSLFFAWLSAFAFSASAAYDLFVGGYPPEVSSVRIEGSVLQVSLTSGSIEPSTAEALDSRFKVTEASDSLAVPFCSLPVAFCITIR